MGDSAFYIVVILAIAMIAYVLISMRAKSSSSASGSSTSSKPSTERDQMVEDIKVTRTSRVVDEVDILNELEQTVSDFRQYCELTGTSQREGGVIAPYSRKQVAYYEIRCYRIDNKGAGDVETLIAHEKSFDPFYFTDDSCDTPIYIDIDSFGENVMLINSTNHVEGPNSDFAKAVAKEGAKATTAAASSSKTSNMVGELASVVVHGFGRARDAVSRLLNGLAPQGAYAFAGAGAAVGAGLSSDGWARDRMVTGSRGAKVSLFGRSGGSGGPGGSSRRGGSSSRPSGGFSGGSSTKPKNEKKPSSKPSGGNVSFPSSPGFDIFLGTGFSNVGGFSNVPRPTYQQPRPNPYPRQTYHRPSGSDVLSEMLTGMVLSSMLDSLSQTSQTTVTTSKPTSTLRGYRLVEDVVPLGSPIYCIGEIYHQGTDVYMGRSLAENYPTSFFATRPESEVLETLGA